MNWQPDGSLHIDPDPTHFTLVEGQLTAAMKRAIAIGGLVGETIHRGAVWIVDDEDNVSVRSHELLPDVLKRRVRRTWPDVKAYAIRREHELRAAEPVSCAICGHEIARWMGVNLWIPGYLHGWGERGWANMGQCLGGVGCRSCSWVWRPVYNPVTSGNLFS